MTELEQRIHKLESQFHKFRISGSEDVSVSGSMVAGGFLISAKAASVDSGTGTGPPPPPPPTTGACCVDADCSITTEADCVGVYQGDDTVCDPNPCLPTGACCVLGACTVGSESDCGDAGGLYLGDGTDCSGDSPCGLCPTEDITDLFVSFTGIVACCDSGETYDISEVNIPFTCSLSSPGLWLSAPVTVDVTVYVNSDCTGEVTSSFTHDYLASISCSGGPYGDALQVDIFDISFNDAFFTGNVLSSNGAVVNSTWVIGGCGVTNIGYGGTAVITW